MSDSLGNTESNFSSFGKNSIDKESKCLRYLLITSLHPEQ